MLLKICDSARVEKRGGAKCKIFNAACCVGLYRVSAVDYGAGAVTRERGLNGRKT